MIHASNCVPVYCEHKCTNAAAIYDDRSDDVEWPPRAGALHAILRSVALPKGVDRQALPDSIQQPLAKLDLTREIRVRSQHPIRSGLIRANSQEFLPVSWTYQHCLRPLLFAFDSEEIHDRTLAGLRVVAGQAPLCEALAAFYGAPDLPVDLFGLRFPNPVGLAAGMDKRAAAVPVWEALGFGFAELGGVTWHEQPGNPQPRMFRAVPDHALINRMGFNNPGAEALAATLRKWKRLNRWPQHPVGINLGKSKVTPLDQAADDYAKSFRALRELADFFVVNVSSPNTPGLRQLQDKAALDEILAALQAEQAGGVIGDQARPVISHQSGAVISDPRPSTDHCPPITDHSPPPRPILVKVAPDLTFEALDEILELVGPRQVAGIVATNTTLARPDTNSAALRKTYAETGGLSGAPLRQRSTEVIHHLYRQTGGKLPIIGVGGILSAGDAWEKITAGASLVQVYTGLVYEGPGITRSIVQGLAHRLQQAGLKRITDAVGLAAK